MALVTHLLTTHSLIGFMNFNAINLVSKMLLVQVVLQHVTQQTIDAVRKIIEDDPYSTYQQIEAILGISSTPINSIIHD